MPKKKWPVPPEILVKAVQKTADQLGGRPGIDNWRTEQCDLCRSFLPKRYRDVLDDWDLRKYAGNIRRQPDRYGYRAPLSDSMGRG